MPPLHRSAPLLYRRTEEDTCGDIIITEERTEGVERGGQRRQRRGKIALSHKRVTREEGGNNATGTEGSVIGGLALCGLPTCVSEGGTRLLPLSPFQCLSPFAVIYGKYLLFTKSQNEL